MTKNKIFSSLGIAALATALAAASLMYGTGSRRSALAAGTNNVITVTGEGVVKVKADIAYITLGVTNASADAQTAQKQNAEKMTAVYSAVKEQGIKEENLETSNFSINPNYDYSTSTRGYSSIVGYTVNNTVKITVTDIKKVSSVLDAAITAGANSNGSINFSISNRSAHTDEAFTKAISNASQKANAIAQAINVKIGTPSSVTENASRSVPYNIYPVNAVADVAKDVGSTPIEAGELEIYATVTVEYKY